MSLRLSLDVSAPRRSLLVEAGVASGLLALGKPPYVVFVLFLLIPLGATGEAHRSCCFCHRRLCTALGVVDHIPTLAFDATRSSRTLPLEVGEEQLRLSRHPHLCANDLCRASASGIRRHGAHTFLFQGSAFPLQMFGLLSDYQVPTIIVLLSAVVVGVSRAVPEPVTGFVLPKLERIGLVGLSLIIGLEIMAVVYTNANALHAPRIDQLTPRYMLPLLPPLLIGVLPSRLRMRSWSPARGAGVGAGSALGTSARCHRSAGISVRVNHRSVIVPSLTHRCRTATPTRRSGALDRKRSS